jgi:membrane-bound lytic murein transglycosylase B
MGVRTVFKGLFVAFLASACVSGASAAPAPANAPLPVAMPEPESRFYGFLRDFKDEALKAGIMETTYDRAVLGI